MSSKQVYRRFHDKIVLVQRVHFVLLLERLVVTGRYYSTLERESPKNNINTIIVRVRTRYVQVLVLRYYP